jgi:cell division protein FtsI/penicillin-binding protein 2
VGRIIARRNPTYGAFVAMDADTGQILALAEYRRNRKSRFRPAFSVRFAAASMFKIVSTAALLETGKVFPWTRVCYHGGRASIGWGNLRNSRRDRHCRNLLTAFAHSTNAVIAKLAVRHLNRHLLIAMARRFGFNRRWQLRGLQTSRAYRPGNRLALARMAAGFINTKISPIHAAVLSAIVSNGGWLVQPHWGIKRVKKRLRAIKQKTASAIQRMMLETTARGTAAKYLSWAKYKGLTVGCKTGTLTSSGLKTSWITCFLRTTKRNIAFSVLSANRGHYRKSGPVARAAVRYLSKNRAHFDPVMKFKE